MKPGKKRQELIRLGSRGDRVRAVVDKTEHRVIVYYVDVDGADRKKKWPITPAGRAEAKAWAEGWHAERQRLRDAASRPTVVRATLRDLWKAYLHARSPFLRDKTRINYAQRFNHWELYLGADHCPNDTTLGDVERYVAESIAAGRAINQVRQIINVARVVYSWGQRMKLITTNELALYRWQKPKDAVVHEPEEYSQEEFDQLMGGLTPQRHEHWRLWAVLMLAGRHGQRANAILHLTEDDVREGDLVWPRAYQKSGEEVVQPLSWEAVAVLETSRYWKRKLGITSRFVIPSAQRRRAEKDEPYSYQAMWVFLCRLEKRVGVAHKKYRALHGLRRKVVGDVIAATGDRMLGLEYVGDKDMKVLKSYDKRMAARVRAASAALDNR